VGTLLAQHKVAPQVAQRIMRHSDMQVTLKDYTSTEKVADLPKRLATDDAPAGLAPVIGDITYSAPWGHLAIFYRDFGYARGLVKLGTIDAGLEALDQPGPVSVEHNSLVYTNHTQGHT